MNRLRLVVRVLSYGCSSSRYSIELKQGDRDDTTALHRGVFLLREAKDPIFLLAVSWTLEMAKGIG